MVGWAGHPKSCLGWTMSTPCSGQGWGNSAGLVPIPWLGRSWLKAAVALWGCLFPRPALVVPSMLVLTGGGMKILPISEVHERMDANSHREPALLA